MVKLHCPVVKDLSKFARKETWSLLYVANNNGSNMLKNCNPSNEHKFVINTRDQPEPGCFIPRSLWDEEMKVPGNEVVFRLSTSWSHRLYFEI